MNSFANKKRTRVHLNVKQKLELIKKVESGVSTSRVCDEYGIKKQTVSDIRKLKDELMKIVSTCDLDSPDTLRKNIKLSIVPSVEDAVYRWYEQERSRGVKIQIADLKLATERLANQMKVDFQPNDSWIWRFRKRHGILVKKRVGE